MLLPHFYYKHTTLKESSVPYCLGLGHGYWFVYSMFNVVTVQIFVNRLRKTETKLKESMLNQHVSVRYRLWPVTEPHQSSSAHRTKLAFKNPNVDTCCRNTNTKSLDIVTNTLVQKYSQRSERPCREDLDLTLFKHTG